MPDASDKSIIQYNNILRNGSEYAVANLDAGPVEIAFVVFLALLLFGPKKLPELAKSVGQSWRELRKSLSGAAEDIASSSEEKPSQPKS